MALPWTASSFRKAARRAKAAGNWYLAVKWYRQALDRNPRYAAFWVQYGDAFKRMRQPNPRSEAALYSVGGSRMQTAVLPMLAARRIGAW